MKITDVKAYICYPWTTQGKRNYIFCKVETDEGVYGVGEAFEVCQDTAIAETIHYYREWLLGQDPMRTEHIWSMLTVYSRQPGGAIAYAAISAIDLALWDIKGKVAGLPVYKLVGGLPVISFFAIPLRRMCWMTAFPTKKKRVWRSMQQRL